MKVVPMAAQLLAERKDMSSDITPLELLSRGLKLLRSRLILQFEQALEKIGPQGELRIIKQDGEIQIIERVDNGGLVQAKEK